ncbi:MAG: helix-turn-helix domain-containing protein, partial [Chryseobacterium sp.]
LIAITPAPKGWINQIRTTLNISQVQYAKKLNVTAPAIADLERREAEGAITLKSLKEAGEVLNLKLVYGFVPMDGSLETMLEEKAKEQAAKIIKRTSITMKLEDQENSPKRLEEAFRELTNDIKKEMPKSLWD